MAANLNDVHIHSFYNIQFNPNNGFHSAVCVRCLHGPIVMRHIHHYGHLYSHIAACHPTNLLQNALNSINNPAPFNAINVLNGQVANLQGQMQGQAIAAANLHAQVQAQGAAAANLQARVMILRAQLLALGIQPNA